MTQFVLYVTLAIFGGVWLYLWNLDAKVKRLEQEMREDAEE